MSESDEREPNSNDVLDAVTRAIEDVVRDRLDHRVDVLWHPWRVHTMHADGLPWTYGVRFTVRRRR